MLAHGVILVTPNWYHTSSSMKLMIDRLVCADGGNPDPTLTHGKDVEKAKDVELAGWPFPKHLAGRVYGLAVHGDVAGIEEARRALSDWLDWLGFIDAGFQSRLARYIWYYQPYATSHDELDKDTDVQAEVRNVARAVAIAVCVLRAGKLSQPDAKLKRPRPKWPRPPRQVIPVPVKQRETPSPCSPNTARARLRQRPRRAGQFRAGGPDTDHLGRARRRGEDALAALVGVATVACLIGDGIWFLAGRRYGLGVLKFLCKVSLSPDSCVRQTESRYGKWGSATLVFGKFIPGVSTVAPPLAGAMNIGWVRFLFFNTLGIFLWVGAAVGIGFVFHAQLVPLLDRFETGTLRTDH